MLRRRSLRARLILGTIVLVLIGLVTADVVTYSRLQSFLIHQTDSSLQAAHVAVENVKPNGQDHDGGHDHGGGGNAPPPPDGSPADIRSLTSAAPGFYIELRRLDGTVVRSGSATRFPGGARLSPPKLPRTIALPVAPQHGEQVTYFTTPARSGSGRYRVRASTEPNLPGYVLVVADPLNAVDGTLRHLLVIEFLVTGLVLLGIAVLGLWVVRLSLRPLDAIGATAAAIAGGDLSSRVARADERTEVGRLGLALNAMLSQIESAFKARQASEQKLRRFVADASHELRTPLAAVRAYAELFTRGAASRPDDLARSMKGITRESERMSVLVEDLLLLAHLDERRPLEQERVPLDDVVLEAVETARTLEPRRPIVVEVEPATVIGDRDRLRRVLDNLLSNVRAHTAPGDPVQVSLDAVDGTARITVADRGPGLTADQVEHVFERFYRTDASRTRASGGVGLGLSIVAAVLEAHDGFAFAESAPGKGLIVCVEIPLAPSEQPEGASAEMLRPVTGASQPRHAV